MADCARWRSPVRTASSALPDIATVSEAGFPDYNVTSWQALAAPAGLPPAILDRLNSELAGVLAEPQLAEKLRALGNEPKASTGDAIKARVANDIETWSKVVADADIERNLKMPMPGRFEGVYANLPTPFTDDGRSLDLYRLHALIDFLLDKRIDGVACLLSSGEYPYLSHSERLELAAEVTRYVAGRVPVIVGVSSLTTAEAIAFAVHAEAIGAAAAMVMPMQYWLLRRDEVIDYFGEISRACSLPLGIYDNPGLRGAAFTAEMYRTLADEARVSVSKDSSGDITRVSRRRARMRRQGFNPARQSYGDVARLSHGRGRRLYCNRQHFSWRVPQIIRSQQASNDGRKHGSSSMKSNPYFDFFTSIHCPVA